MRTKEIIELEIFFQKVDDLFKKGCSVIIRENNWYYTFRIYDSWYSIYYNNDYGMNINLSKGDSIDAITTHVYSAWCVGNKSQERTKCESFFLKLNKLYVAQNLFNKTFIIDVLKNFIDLLENIESIEKLSENIFIVKVNKICYSFIRKESYNTIFKRRDTILIVSQVDNNSDGIYEEKNYDKIASIFAMLNVVWELNKCRNNVQIDEKLFSFLRLTN